MSESLIQQYFMSEKTVVLVVKLFRQLINNDIICNKKSRQTSTVPAAAVRLGGPALFIIIGREGCVGGLINLLLKTKLKYWYCI